MIRLLICMLAALTLQPAAARAGTEPMQRELWDWVQRIEIPAADPKRGNAPVQFLLATAQSRYGAGPNDHYVETASLAQTAQGVSVLGNIALPWDPDRMDLFVHKVHIIRSGKVIDLLASQKFLVLRRENNLERAVLDGVLTAALAPEGLTIGDIVNVAFTIREKQGAIPFRAENFLMLAPDNVLRRVFYRQVWSDEAPLRWRSTPEMGAPRLTKTRLGNELVLDLADAAAPTPPGDAPARYAVPASLELSGYRDWAEVSSLFAAPYESASVLGPESPLRAEAAKIAAASADPARRMLAALRLVQDRIRYVALAMGDGGFVPASADQTWVRRFGDCKGKSATLIALLRELGIKAEPVLVSSLFGDSLADRLPLSRLFDHVIVRAEIDGRSYWLDGTRTGDRTLDDLASSSFGYGLPIRAAGAQLTRLPLTAPASPMTETIVNYDASEGFARPVPVSGEVRLSGNLATLWRLGLAQQGEDATKKELKDLVPVIPNTDFEITRIDADEATNRFTFAFSGKTRMAWSQIAESRTKRFEFDDRVVSWKPKFEREAGPFKDAPFALSFPYYAASTETVILPGGGAGFKIEGGDIDQTVAGTRITRKLTLAGGKAVAVSKLQRLQREISASEGKAALPAIQAINDRKAFVLAPSDYDVSAAELAAILSEQPTDAEGYVQRGYRLMREGRIAAAIPDFKKAAELAPEWSLAHANLGIAFIHKREYADARTALAKAAALDNEEFAVHQGYGMLALSQDDPSEAVRAFTRSLQFDSANPFTLTQRAKAYEQLGQLREALADVEKALGIDPSSADAQWSAAILHAELGNQDQAIAVLDKGIGQDPDNAYLPAVRGELLARFGRTEEASKSFDRSLTLMDARIREAAVGEKAGLIEQKVMILSTAGRHRHAIDVASEGLRRSVSHTGLLAARCLARAAAKLELEQGLKDCDEAAELDPERLMTAHGRGLALLQLGRWDAAVETYTKALSWEPRDSRSFYGRGIARARKGDKAGSEQDLARARRYGFATHTEFDDLGIRP